MEVSDIKAILKREYGIENEEDFNNAVKEFEGIDLGIFTVGEKEEKDVV